MPRDVNLRERTGENNIRKKKKSLAVRISLGGREWVDRGLLLSDIGSPGIYRSADQTTPLIVLISLLHFS